MALISPYRVAVEPFATNTGEGVITSGLLTDTVVDMQERWIGGKSVIQVTLTGAGAVKNGHSKRRELAALQMVLGGDLNYRYTVPLKFTLTGSDSACVFQAEGTFAVPNGYTGQLVASFALDYGNNGIVTTDPTVSTILAYVSPTLNEFKMYRSNSTGTAKPDGDYARYSVTLTRGSMNITSAVLTADGVGTVNVLYDNTGTEAQSFDDWFPSRQTVSTSTGYNVTITVTDESGETITAERLMPQGKALVSLNPQKNGIGIGKFSETENLLDINLPAVSRVSTGKVIGGTKTTSITVNNGSAASVTVSLTDGSFTTAPLVLITEWAASSSGSQSSPMYVNGTNLVISGTSGDALHMQLLSVSASQFVVVIYNNSGTAVVNPRFNWVAIDLGTSGALLHM